MISETFSDEKRYLDRSTRLRTHPNTLPRPSERLRAAETKFDT